MTSIPQPQPDFDQKPPAAERVDFPSKAFVLDQLRSAADDVVLETLAYAAVRAIDQRDGAQAVLRAALAQLHRLNAEIDRLRAERADDRERAGQRRRAA